MAVTKKQDSSDKKDQGKKDRVRRDGLAKKDIVLSKDKKEVVKKEPSAKKDLPVKKDQVNRVEQVQKFLRGAFSELKKVHWPNRREIIIYTSVVVVAVVAVGVLIWLFDSALSFVLKFIL
ncbi:MAG: preprotein translocase subunit SecE [Desulfotomaculaceae bacterium]|nr:preprotein translocase subunit SecE [Desulfotomaculaceae bacterium]